jgi:predicted unusual protein kinase regulating ubiquinone biosynthesis (AarF/ABC1/UbiB family)
MRIGASLLAVRRTTHEATSVSKATVSALWHAPTRALSLAPREATAAEGAEFRSFVHDLIAACGSGDRTGAIRESIAKHSVILNWIGEGRDFDSLCRAADLEVDARRFVHRTLLRQLNGVLGSTLLKLAGPILWPTAGGTAEVFTALDHHHRVRLLASIGDRPFHAIARGLDDSIGNAKVSNFAAVRTLRDPTQGIDLGPELPQSLVHLFQRLMVGYFDQLPIQDKRTMLGALLELPPKSSLAKQLSAVVQHAGPAIQKLFQFFGRDARSEWVRDVLKDLLSNVEPVRGPIVRGLIEAELGQPIEEVFSEFSDAPLSSGTVGQTHAAKLKSTGEEVVVKIIKPGVREAAMREIETLRSLVNPDDPFEASLVDNIARGLARELDLRNEAKNIQAGRCYINPAAGITIARAIDAIPATENLIVQERARGKPMSTLPTPAQLADRGGVTELAQRSERLGVLIASWFESAMFDGFFHADLHLGNRFWDQGPLLTLIDFGSADRLTPVQRRAFVGLSLAATAKSAPHALKVLKTLSDLPPGEEKNLERDLNDILWRSDGILDRIPEMLKAALERRMPVPMELFLFSRGHGFLSRELREVNAALDRADPQHKVPRQDSLAIYRRTLERHMPELAGMVGAELSPALLTNEFVNRVWANRGRIAEPAKGVLNKVRQSWALRRT